jgi:hypothetical protein
MMGAPDQFADEAKIHAAELQRARQGARRVKIKKLARLRLIVRRLLGRQDPPGDQPG